MIKSSNKIHTHGSNNNHMSISKVYSSVDSVLWRIQVRWDPAQEHNLKGNLPFGVIGLQKTQIGLPFISNHFTTSETPNWNNHCDTVEANQAAKVQSTLQLESDVTVMPFGVWMLSVFWWPVAFAPADCPTRLTS